MNDGVAKSPQTCFSALFQALDLRYAGLLPSKAIRLLGQNFCIAVLSFFAVCREKNDIYDRRGSVGLVLSLLLLLLVTACVPVGKSAPAPATGTLYGTVLTSSGAPAIGAYVYAYKNNDKGLRGPADFGARVDLDGRYLLDVVSGEYHLIARQRQSGGGSGPPRAGDAWAVYPENPIRIVGPDNGPADFRLRPGTGLHQVRQGSLTSGDTGFSGTLVAVDGEAMGGAFVLAYRSADFRRMPDFTSLPAGPDGRFILYVPEPGSYCLAARKQTRGLPSEGEPYGTLGQGDDSCRQVDRSEILEVGRIILRPHRR